MPSWWSKLPSWWSKLPRWLQMLLVWAALGVCVLFFGGLAMRGLEVLWHWGEAGYDPGPGRPFFRALLTFSIGGGITIGFLILIWWMIAPPDVRWGLGIAVLCVLLFALFVWPTPYAYWKTGQKGVLLKVNRLTGQGEYVPTGSR